MMMLTPFRRVALAATIAALALMGSVTVAAVRPALAGALPAIETTDPSEDCGEPSAIPVVDGQPILVTLVPVTFTVGNIDPYVWRHPLNADLGWRLWFEGFMYLPPLALRAYNDGAVQSLDTMVAQVVAFHAQNPDPGTNSYGWDEGTAQRRLQTENCLYRLTSDSRLQAGMAADVAVQFGPRYYGPPYARVHNHGVMANLRIVRAGELLGVDSWRIAAIQRLQAEAPLAFSPLGTTWEQSTEYQSFSMRLWDQAADLLRRHEPGSTAIPVIDAATDRAKVVLSWMTEPDGYVVPIGDSSASVGPARDSTDRVFRDDIAGWLIGRWSWTDPSTTYYLLRYGPTRWAHGHDDRGAVVWTTWGEQILVDPGYYGGDVSSSWGVWQWSAAAHNVAILSGVRRPTAAVKLIAGTVQGPAHAWQVEDDLYSLHHTRVLNIFRSTRTLRVRDSYAGPGIFDQYWHLGPTWQLVQITSDRRTAIFAAASGRRLTITSSGLLAQVVRGATRPIAGWVFPAPGQLTAAWQLRVRAVTRTIVTTFVVS